MNPNFSMIESIVGTVIGIIVLFAVVKIMVLPFQLLFKLIINAVFGAAMLYFINWLGIIQIKITLVHSLIAGIFGVPGVIGIIIYTHFLK